MNKINVNKLNVEQICSVKIIVNSYSNWYVYKESKKIFSFEYQKEGYYFTMTIEGSTYKTVEEIEKDDRYICKNKRVYFKPHLEIKMSNGNIHKKYFETKEELYDFIDSDVMKGIKFIDAK